MTLMPVIQDFGDELTLHFIFQMWTAVEGGDEWVVSCSKSQVSKVKYMVITRICGILSIDDWPCHTGENQTQYNRTFDLTSHTSTLD